MWFHEWTGGTDWDGRFWCALGGFLLGYLLGLLTADVKPYAHRKKEACRHLRGTSAGQTADSKKQSNTGEGL